MVKLRRAGTYAVNYTFVVPENYTLFTHLCLSLNGEEVEGSRIEIDKDTTSNSMVYSGQAIVEAEECGRLCLESSESIDIEAGRTDTIATMTVHKL